MSFQNYSSNKNDSKKVELTSSAKKLFRRATEIKDDSNTNLIGKSGYFKKTQIEVCIYPIIYRVIDSFHREIILIVLIFNTSSFKINFIRM